MAVIETDLVIVGGGPTGLLSAHLARSQGLSVYVIDEKPGPLDLGRADALNARTQQLLEVSKTLDYLLSEGITCDTSSTFEAGQFTSRQSHWWTTLEHCYRKNFLMIGQPRVEAALLQQLDVSVDYSSRATSLTESDSHVIVRTDKGKSIQAKYAIACDGARSSIRTSLDIPFTGSKPEMVWAVLDTFIKTDFPECKEIITFQVDGQARVSWIPRERGMARFYILLDGEVTQQKAEDSIRRHMAPHEIEFVKTEWFSTFEIKERVAGSFISKHGNGRVFLAGDAAHVHAVNGGQGLNTGVSDAFALSWRLALAVKGVVGREVLRSYDSERRSTAENVVDTAAKLVRLTKKTAREYVDMIELSSGFITGMGIAYSPNSVVVRDSRHGIFEAGKRCPDLNVTPFCNGSVAALERRLYSLFKYGKFVVLLPGRQAVSAPTDRYKSMAEFWIVHSGEQPLDLGIPEFKVTWASEDTEEAVVIRPDMYIGYAGRDWQEYLDGMSISS